MNGSTSRTLGALLALGVLCTSGLGCGRPEGDVNIFFPGGDGGMGLPGDDCVPGSHGSCGIGVGQCTLGDRICGPDGFWGRCVGEGSARDEICDAVDNDCDGRIDDDVDCRCDDEIEVCLDRRDNNCNGEVDENCACTPGFTEPCVSAVPGACRPGTMTCRPDGHSFTECLPVASPAAEACDGIDNDCDGIADEDVCECSASSTRSCLTGLSGACRTGQQTCNAGGRGFGPCLPTVTESDEACDDGVDNDCDGTADEGCDCTTGDSRPCVSALPGECAAGLQVCGDSQWGFCIPDIGAAPEVCDGLDNDCDGVADEEVCSCPPGATRSCHSGLDGVCDIGSQTCTADGRGWNTCVSLNVPSAERCDGLDNDCDGVADDDSVCSCMPGEIRACSSGIPGACTTGTQRCRMDGRSFDPCVATATAGPEVCDGIDNDCDGVADEEVCDCTPGSTRGCLSGSFGACAAGVQTCTAGGRGFTPCLPLSGPASEACDGIDNDCDGTADEEVCACLPGEFRFCLTGLFGECADGFQFCRADGRGFDPCEAWVLPFVASPDVCGDGVDNDCDGPADEGCDCTPGVVLPCVSGLPGVCSAGTRTCTADGRMYGDCLPVTAPSAETCDGLDNDCDGTADEQVCTCPPTSTRPCISGLGGVCAAGIQSCSADGRGWNVCLPTTGPSLDACGDGLDSDCDGSADEGCICTAGASRPCTTSLPGICSAGTQSCTGGLTWGSCIPTFGGLSETCDGLDNDCDGVADEEVCDCAPLSVRACTTSLPGACAPGTQTCDADGRGYSPCQPTTAPSAERCGDGVDNDCDGPADEGCACAPGVSRACLSGLSGACSAGLQTCDAGGAWNPCLPTGGASPEVCNGIDDDCDGLADDDAVCTCTPGASASCLTGISGVCGAGIMTCIAGGRGFTACLPTSGASAEVCNGLDDDCDGMADEGVCSCPAGSIRACATGIPGACSAGNQTCDASGSGWGPCLSTLAPTVDACGDGIDSDCDGNADEGCVCTPGASQACLTGLDGVCGAGLQTCTAGRAWSPCLPSAGPSPEVCNGIDDDCDGNADDDGVCMCTVGVAASCLTGLAGVCAAGTHTCIAGGRGFTACLPTAASGVEVCNGLDDDCDGEADEGVCSCPAGLIQACDTGIPGVCTAGSQTCDASGSGWGPCLTAVVRSADVCGDGLDNDCDGPADEDCACTSGVSRPCVSSLPGVCASGTQACTGGRWDACIPTAAATSEVCDGRDNDCDGNADENVCTCTPLAPRACITTLPGACAAGTQRCDADGTGYSPCLPTSAPSVDVCGDGVDNDCDGPADEGCACTPGVGRVCVTGFFGACGIGSQTCDPTGRSWSPCLPAAGPTSEICDGVDNDCDGNADDDGVCTCTVGASSGCLTGLPGVCSAGNHVCTAGGRSFTACLPTTPPAVESCNGLDDDCDGLADEGVCACVPGSSRACETADLGACHNGVQTCRADGSGYDPCVASAGPTSETCNGRDDDCDGVADEQVCTCPPGVTRGCLTGLDGVCAAGLETCSADGRGWSGCLPTTGPTSDTCADGLDSDCDGTADDGCTCTSGATRSCLTGLSGACSSGLQTCDSGRTWTPCLPTSGTSAEACNGIDDDCDGLADEDGICTCVVGAVASCLSGLPGVCAIGLETCTSGGRGFTSCLPAIAPSAEACNGIDDDCDGLADEDGVCTCVPFVAEICSTGLAGACGPGTHTCRADGRGFGPCVGAAGPASDVCDGVDNDCDGAADEDGVCTCTPGASRGCVTGLPGVCSAGTQTCDGSGRNWSICLATTAPSVDACGDGLDNDCDNTADENCACSPGAIRVCMTGLDGACSGGTQSCDPSGRDWSPCLPTVVVTAETCPGDGIDSDCDGTADEGCACTPGSVEACLTGLPGLCTMGTMTCRADGHSFTACLPTSGPVSEIPSNGTDDDCNGITDDVASCAPGTIINCATGLTGLCARGEQTCLPSGGGFGPCVLLTGGNPEVCGDGFDNNCNGQVNEGCACAPGSSLSCSTGMPGVCAAGTTTCFADGSGFGPCSPTTFGGPESAAGCNGIDDDCNGVIDNNIAPACP